MDRERIASLRTIYRDGLLLDTLPFWLPRCVDQECGGFLTAFNRDGSLVDDDKYVWQQGRFTWLLGELYNEVEPREEWLDLAIHGADFLEKYCFDPSDGRMWFHLTRTGQPLRKRRYAFSESFASIAFGELAKATGDSRYADLATRTFHRFVEHNLHPPVDQQKFTDVRPTRGFGFPMISIVTAQQLRDSIDMPGANAWIDTSINAIRQFFFKPEIECVLETVGDDGKIIEHFDGRTLNPGHAIEGAWFIMREARARADEELLDMGLKMLDWMWARGWDRECGGLLYFVDIHGMPVQEYWHDMKFWWPHNEAIIATMLAFALTGNSKYADWHAQVHDWTYRHFPDAKHGEWFGYLHRNGTVSLPLKGNVWKGPFHLPRMQLNCWQIAEELLSRG